MPRRQERPSNAATRVLPWLHAFVFARTTRHAVSLAFSSTCLFGFAVSFFLLLGTSLAAAEESPQQDADSSPSVADSLPSAAAPSPRAASSPPPPIGIRHGQPLSAGRLRLGYSYEERRYREILVSGSDRTQGELLGPAALTVPTFLKITEHIVEIAYAPHDRVTLVAEIPILVKELGQLSASGRSEIQRTGLGDISFSVVVPFIQKGRESSHVHVSVEVPSGSIKQDVPGGRLPYDLQLGNGTWDLEWGWTYRGERDDFSWGAQFTGHHPVGSNSLHYREGSRFDASLWTGVRIFRGLTATLRISGEKQNNIRGQDRSLSLVADGPSANSKARGGFHVDVRPGLSLEIPQLNRHRVAVEFGVPVYQELDGPQLSRDYSFKVGWQWVY